MVLDDIPIDIKIKRNTYVSSFVFPPGGYKGLGRVKIRTPDITLSYLKSSLINEMYQMSIVNWMMIVYKQIPIKKTAFEILNHENLTGISIIRVWGKLLEDL